MRLTAVFVALGLSLVAQASWFGSDSTDTANRPYATWTTSELKDWLDIHGIDINANAKTQSELRTIVEDNWNKVSTWTYDQYASAQKGFADLRDTNFENWDESRLKEFLLAQGVVAPKGPKDRLVLMAKERYRAYSDAASSFSSMASASASSVYYADKTDMLSRTASSLAAQATRDVARAFDSTKDYIYSTWDETAMHKWLVDKGYLRSGEQKKKDELLAMMNEYYGKVANPVWEAWSDSYLHHWLVMHNIISPDTPKTHRDYLAKKMHDYYYSTSDNVYSTWSDTQLHRWLVDHNLIKSDAKISRDKMLRMVEKHYLSAKDTFWHAWTDNDLRKWLVENGYIKSDVQKRREEMIKLAEERYNEAHGRTAAYLAWPDARLRAYLRERGVSEDMVPGSRPGLLQETRIRWVQAENHADSVLAKIRDLVNDGSHKVEDVLGHVLNLVTAGYIDVRRTAADEYDAVKEGYDDMKQRTEREYRAAERAGKDSYGDAKRAGSDSYENAKKAGRDSYENAKKAGRDSYENAKKAGRDSYENVKDTGKDTYDDAKRRAEVNEEWAEDKWGDGREYVGEKIKTAGEKVKGEL